MSQEICKECEGDGIITAIDYTPACCGFANSDGSCCNNPIQEQIQVQEQCHNCKATGYLETDLPKRNEKGYPLDKDGNIDWELTSKEKDAFRESFEREEHGGRLKSRKKHATNYTKPKKRRK